MEMFMVTSLDVNIMNFKEAECSIHRLRVHVSMYVRNQTASDEQI
jgi:hypothetical protein